MNGISRMLLPCGTERVELSLVAKGFAKAMYPDLESWPPAILRGMRKATRYHFQHGEESFDGPLSDADLALLTQIWGRLPSQSDAISENDWASDYDLKFSWNAAVEVPWKPAPVWRDYHSIVSSCRAMAEREHWDALRFAVRTGRLVPRTAQGLGVPDAMGIYLELATLRIEALEDYAQDCGIAVGTSLLDSVPAARVPANALDEVLECVYGREDALWRITLHEAAALLARSTGWPLHEASERLMQTIRTRRVHAYPPGSLDPIAPDQACLQSDRIYVNDVQRCFREERDHEGEPLDLLARIPDHERSLALASPLGEEGLDVESLLAHRWPIGRDSHWKLFASSLQEGATEHALRDARTLQWLPSHDTPRWDPVALAIGLASRHRAGWSQLDLHIRNHFPAWVPRWEAARAAAKAVAPPPAPGSSGNAASADAAARAPMRDPVAWASPPRQA